jgi:hypothetical protein
MCPRPFLFTLLQKHFELGTFNVVSTKFSSVEIESSFCIRQTLFYYVHKNGKKALPSHKKLISKAITQTNYCLNSHRVGRRTKQECDGGF